VYRGVFPGLEIVAALIVCATVPGVEPDGRVAFRYLWPDKPDGDPETPRLRLSITAFVDLAETRLSVTLPTGIMLIIRAAGRAPTPWPEEGLEIGDLVAGQTIIVDLDVARPPPRAGIVAFVLRGLADGTAVREGVGVPVGAPGTAPTLRDGIAEFPAAREDPAP